MGANAEKINREWLESLSDTQLHGLLRVTRQTLQNMARYPGVVIEEAELSKSLPKLRQEYFREIDGIAQDLEDGRINLKTFDRRSHDAITKNFRKTYESHLGRALDEGDELYLQRAAQTEMKHARAFGRDIKGGRLRMPRAKRSGMYANTLNGISWNAMVEKQPDNVRIRWKLGTAEHCVDCIILASQSPYTKASLPTTPRAGATACLSNCKCKLTFQVGVLSQEEMEDAAEYSFRKDQSLREMIEPPPPPKGLRFPDTAEQRYINNLRNKMNYQRRLIGSGELTGKELKDAVRLRAKFNQELIEFTEANGIWDVPLMGVDDILDERHIGKRAVNDIFRHGLDGSSLDTLSQRKLASLLDHYEKEVGEAFSDEMIIASVKKSKRLKKPKKGMKDEDMIADFLAEGSDMDDEMQAAIRKSFNDVFSEYDMVNRAGKQGGKKKLGKKGKQLAVKRHGGYSGCYNPKTGLIDIDDYVADGASRFLLGERDAYALDAFHTMLHETAHAHSKLSLKFDVYSGSAMVIEEVGCDLVADKIMIDKFGLSWKKVYGSASYDKFANDFMKSFYSAAKEVKIKLKKMPKKKGLFFPSTSESEAIVDAMSDAFIKIRRKGKLFRDKREYIKKFLDELELPKSMLKGLSAKEKASLIKKFKFEFEFELLYEL